jgi:hypothetical protein
MREWALEVCILTVNQMDSSTKSIVDGGEHNIADSGEFL